MSWQDKAQAKRAAILAKIPPPWRLSVADVPPAAQLKDVTTIITRFLSPLEVAVTNETAINLLESVRCRKWSATEVAKAFCHRSALAHQLTNCLAEINFDPALQRAAELDKILQSTGQLAGPLHGLPISLKDRFHVDGLESACGYISWLGDTKTSKDEGVIVKGLRAAGAVIIAKTAVPMSMLVAETTNNITGSTTNPFNRTLSVGGASGGEGALLALRGSPIGWGSDLAGSIRIPAAFNNLYALRPSFGRLSTSGLATSLPGLPTGADVVGPMCADLASLGMLAKWAVDLGAWRDDFEVVDMPWSSDKVSRTRSRTCQQGQRNGKLVFGIMSNDGMVSPHPPVQRAMSMLVDALRQHGYELIEWVPPSHNEGMNVHFQMLGATAGSAIRTAVDASHEPPIPQLADFYTSDADPLPTTEFWRLNERREDFRARYHEYWKSTQAKTSSKWPVDAVILPIAAHAAPPEGQFRYYAYSAVASVLDYTTGVVPVTFADERVDFPVRDYLPQSLDDRKNWHLYQQDVFDGSPVGLQVMGQRFQEEKILVILEAIKLALEEYTATGSGESQSPWPVPGLLSG